MRIIADENIPYAREAFGSFGEVALLPGRKISQTDLEEADILIVRSITQVDRSLLEGTPVRFVGTATIGTDHVDLEYLSGAGIAFADAAGSNSNSVAEYVIAALLELNSGGHLALDGARVGIIGVGNVGSKVAAKCAALGLECVLYDPPLDALLPGFHSARWEELFGCDVITLHVPLVKGGLHPTHHLMNKEFLDAVKSSCILVNTSRGGIVESGALLNALATGKIKGAVLDVWEGEPDIPLPLVSASRIATPHIAGYSYDAKLQGTEMMAQAIGRFLGQSAGWRTSDVVGPVAEEIRIPDILEGKFEALHFAVSRAYDICADDTALRALLALPDDERRARFDLLRKNYPQRLEWSAYTIRCNVRHEAALRSLGFTVATPSLGV